MALANILMIGLLLRVFYEDIKDRKVTFIVLVILLLLGGFIHSQHQNLWVFFLSSLLNLSIVLTIIMQWIYRYHKFGNHIHFVGDNKASSQMMGINVDNVKIIAFVQLGFFSSLAGIFTMYEMLYFWPTQGSGLMLTTLAAVFVGGTSVFGGKGTIFGTFIGVLIIGSLESGIIALGLSGFYVQFINGLMITSAVTIYALIQRKKT